ncbi:MAG TPA: glycosyltransferase family 9 protein [Abditibacteriaceae bacterium]|jgi:ADP-heptose:LPS heptosyltransferase
MKILIIRLSSIGDCVLASPVLEALRERYPEAHLTWAVQSKSVSVVRGLPGLDETLLWDDRRRRWRSLARALWNTRRARFDVALDLQGLDKAGLFAIASAAKRRVTGEGARRIAHWSGNEHVEEGEKTHARLFYLRRAAGLDIAPDAAERFFPRVPITALHRRFADEFLTHAGFTPDHRIIGLNLGAAHAVKRWAPERFARLANTLLTDDERARIVVFGAPADAPILEKFEIELASLQSKSVASGNAWSGRVLTAVGRVDLMQLAAIAERSSAFITADTGPMHVVAAVGAPMVALFGPTDVAQTGPVWKPGAAPIRVVNGREIGEIPKAPMDIIKVQHVLDEVNALEGDVAAWRARNADVPNVSEARSRLNGKPDETKLDTKPRFDTKIVSVARPA